MTDTTAKKPCNGKGYCLMQDPYNPEKCIEKYKCAHQCKPFPCINNRLCRTECPIWIAHKNQGACEICKNDLLGPLVFREGMKTRCPICNLNKREVKLPQCCHLVCIPCARIMFRFDEQDPLGPEDDDQYKEWQRVKEIEYILLTKCPVCRKEIKRT